LKPSAPQGQTLNWSVETTELPADGRRLTAVGFLAALLCGVLFLYNLGVKLSGSPDVL